MCIEAGLPPDRNTLARTGYEAERVGIFHCRSAAPRSFQQALEEYGLALDDPKVYVQPCKGSIDAGYESARSLLLGDTRPTAIVAMSDIVAIGALLAAKELGLQVPKDVAVAGFDDIPECIISTPRLTTIHQPAREKGIEAARMVMHMLDGASGSHIRLPYRLIERESTRMS